MAQTASSKVQRGFIGFIRYGIRRRSGEIFCSNPNPKLYESWPFWQSHPKSSFSSSSFSREAFLVQQQWGHVKKSCGGEYLFAAHVAKAIRGVRGMSFSSSQGEVKFLAAREPFAGYRSALQGFGLQRLGVDSRLQLQRRILSSHSNNVKQEVNLLIKPGSREGLFRGLRTYHVDNRGVSHFKRRGPASWTEKLASQRSMGMLLFVVGGGLVLYVTNLQTVPYTHRKHFMLVSPNLERAIGDRSFEMIMKEYKTKVLPPHHPESKRVHKISDQIIEALMLGVGSSDWSKPDNASVDIIHLSKEWDKDPLSRPRERPVFESYGSHNHSDSEILDETWVDKSRKDGLQTGQQGYTKHLEGMKWKVLVVDDEIVNAICIPGGKIVVFTGLLRKFHADTEVATVVAHEIGHAVARHSAEALTHNVFIVALQLIALSVFYVPGLVNSISELLLRLPFSRRMEIEADHIGLILMAAAGYDPRLAPGFYEKLGKLEKVPEYAQYMSTHPSGKRRGELLRNTATMEEALTLYRQKMSGQGTEGFF